MSIVLASQAIADVTAMNYLSDSLHVIGESDLVSKFSSKPPATGLAFTIFFPSEDFSVTTQQVLMVDCPSSGVSS